MYPGQVIHDGLEAYAVPEFLFYGGNISDKNTRVDISNYAKKRVKAGMSYISQWSSGWSNYRAPALGDYPEEDREAIENRVRRRILVENGKSFERFRYHKGAPDTMGHAPRD
jgi:hypothetical protein